MSRNIVIIGGGISGLALLHYLKQKYLHSSDVDIQLLEKNDHLGGTIRSFIKDGCLFETGPNGFLDSKKRTLEFVKELELESSLVRANQESKIRYLSIDNRLHKLPSSPQSFLSFKLLNFSQKLRVLGEFFIPKENDPQESVYDFGKRRLGEKFSKVFLDPMVSGITGGDARTANLKAVFPRIYALEEEYGSLFKAMIKIRKARKSTGNGGHTNNSDMGAPTGTLTSFQKGVAQLIEAMSERYAAHIQCGQDVQSIARKDHQYEVIAANGQRVVADELFLCAPAYSAASMIEAANKPLAQALAGIKYAPMAVVGLVYPLEYFTQKPKGYGYLIPSSEQKEVLGVLFDGNIFPGRCRDDQILFRVMIGGMRHPDILRKTKDQLVDCAIKEIDALPDKTPGSPQDIFFVPWAKAIPQYDHDYCQSLTIIEAALEQMPNVHLVANYLKGVSLNDCIESAYQGAESSSL